MAWGAAIGAIAGGLFSRAGASSANAANIGLNRENRNWQEKMAGSEVQRRVRDLKLAGLNPMLGYSGQASTPSSVSPRVENEWSGANQAAGNVASALALRTQKSVIASNEAAARASDAGASHQAQLAREAGYRADILKPKVPYAEGSAGEEADMLQMARQKLGTEIEKLSADRNLAETIASNAPEMQRLELAGKKILNDLNAAKVPLEKLKEQLWRQVQDGKNMTPELFEKLWQRLNQDRPVELTTSAKEALENFGKYDEYSGGGR